MSGNSLHYVKIFPDILIRYAVGGAVYTILKISSLRSFFKQICVPVGIEI